MTYVRRERDFLKVGGGLFRSPVFVVEMDTRFTKYMCNW